MKLFLKAAAGVALLGATALMANGAAHAAPLAATGGAKSAAAQLDNIEQVQQRRGGGGRPAGRGGGRRGGGGGGGAAAAAIGIGIIGGIIATEAARAAARDRDAAIRACMRRYRSYDPETQTFVGRDGRVYRCP